MKFFKITLISLLILSALVYLLLFTKPGNKILKPYIEKSIKKHSGVEISLTSFTLKPATFKLAGKLASASFIIDGKYNLFKASGAGVYKLDINNLAQLKKLFNLNIDIQGDYFGTGSFSGNKEKLIIDGKGKLGGIDIDYKAGLIESAFASLNIGIYNADLNKALHLINKSHYYIFDSIFNADINYNLKTEKGDFTADFENGSFVHNRLSELILQLTQFDLTKQVYENALIKGTIDKKIITADIDLKSPDVKITAKNAILDIGNNTIEALLNINIKDKSLKVTIKGKTEKPQVKVDVSEYIKTEVKKKAEEYIDIGNETINKFLKKIF